MTASRITKQTAQNIRQIPVTDRILDVAEQLAQTRGFNGFSYADIAKEMFVTKASLHYHYPSKADLGRALIMRYKEAFMNALEVIDRQENNAHKKLQKYIGLYESVIRKDRMCLCGMFAAEYTTLPPEMQAELRLFFDVNERWLAQVLEQGLSDHDLEFKEPPQERARVLLGALEGAMLVARSYGDFGRFRSAAKHIMAGLVVGKV